MELNKIITEINKLGLSEKIILVEDIWDSIAQSNSDLPMSQWQKKELKNRYSEYKAGKMSLYEWGAVHENLRKKYK